MIPGNQSSFLDGGGVEVTEDEISRLLSSINLTLLAMMLARSKGAMTHG